MNSASGGLPNAFRHASSERLPTLAKPIFCAVLSNCVSLLLRFLHGNEQAKGHKWREDWGEPLLDRQKLANHGGRNQGPRAEPARQWVGNIAEPLHSHDAQLRERTSEFS